MKEQDANIEVDKAKVEEVLTKLRRIKKIRFINTSGPYLPEEAGPVVNFNALNQIDLKPELRQNTILRYKNKDTEGLFSEIQKMLGRDNRSIKTNPFYWTESPHKTLKQIVIDFFKDPLGIKRRKNRRRLTEFLNKPKRYIDHVDYWNL